MTTDNKIKISYKKTFTTREKLVAATMANNLHTKRNISRSMFFILDTAN